MTDSSREENGESMIFLAARAVTRGTLGLLVPRKKEKNRELDCAGQKVVQNTTISRKSRQRLAEVHNK